MKNFNLGLCAIVIALFGVFLVQSTPVSKNRILGAKQCTWGPSYWCKNLTNAKNCHAVRHCIQTVWESQSVPQDDGGICKICKDMVTQARDQLRSNQTMDEMRQVFEGSCKLIPLKVVTKECIKMVDDFIPELVEALTSQMNPDQVCTVAGLCNNAHLNDLYLQAARDALNEDSLEQDTKQSVSTKPLLTCGNCNQLAGLMEKKFNTLSHDDILANMLRMCGQLGSFSDSCAAIALNYFDEFYEHLKHSFDAAGLCHLSGSCVAKYHQHPDDVKEAAPIDLEKVEGDDIPCELCEQLVKHLRDVLIANTTEAEFKQVMEGLCNQTKNFKSECLSIVDQYYEVIYNTLVNNLDANGACFMIGICPASLNSPKLLDDIRPLLPVFPPAHIEVSIRQRQKLGAHEPKFTQEELQSMQLPIDRLMGAQNPNQLVNGGELCTICEYFIHFMQETLATPKTEDEIKKKINELCDKMGSGVKGHCHDFIDMYADPIIALIIQGMDPRQICPKLRVCPGVQEDVDVFYPQTIVNNNDESDKPTCPLCIFAVEEAKAKIKDDKSKKTIENVLHGLCQKLPTKMQSECVDFVNTYYNELLDKLISNFTSKEICVDLKLCPVNDDYLENLGIFLDKSEESSELEDMSVDEVVIEQATPDCLLCEELLKLAEKRIGKKPTKESIKKRLDVTCGKLNPHLRMRCHQFVVKHGDQIAELILKETEPKVVCRELGYCLFSEPDDLEIDEALKYDVIAMPNEQTVPEQKIIVKDPPTCVLCEFIMTKLELELHNKTTQDEIKHTIEHICEVMPKTVSKSCNKFIEQYANTILMLIGTMPPKLICQNMMLCASANNLIITDDVIECGVCHGALMPLLPYLKQHADRRSLTRYDMSLVGCENLPAKYYSLCSDMLEVYGPSILNLSETDKNEAEVCSEIGKCFNHELSGLAFAKISA